MELGKKQELEKEAKEFFQNSKKEIIRSVKNDQVVPLDFYHLSKFSPMLSEKLLETPEEIIALLELCLEEQAYLPKPPRIRFTSLPDSVKIKIKEIRAKHLDQFITIEGIVRQASDVRPQVVNARFECPTCGAILSVLQIDRKFREPSRCSCGRKGLFKLLSKELVDAQRLVIEESPDSLEGGEQPRRMNVFLKEDLVDPRMEDRTTPGSKVRIIGVLKEVPVPLQQGSISTRFDLAIEANNAIPLEETFDDLEVNEKDEEQIKKIATDPKAFERLASSIAPSVYGFKEVKEAILLQLFSGVKKKRSDGGNTRGDIHVLLVGDPGVAKSVTLKFVSRVAPKGRYVSGKAATGAGLTAAVVKDEFLKGWSLEAGAMVLSNKGTVCIDEIEKMDEHDRSTMHESMEQQCYHKDTIISLADGQEVKIGELVESLLEKNKEKIIQGKDCLILHVNDLELLTTDWKNISPIKATRISKHKAFKKFIKIKLSHGREIIVTPEHPVFTVKDGKIITKRADNIQLEDPIPIPLSMPISGKKQVFEKMGVSLDQRIKQHPTIPTSNCRELFKIVGYIVSEGSKERNRGKLIGINFANKDEIVIKDFEECMKKTFNLKPYKQIRIDPTGPMYFCRYISRELSNFILKNMHEMIRYAGEKEIPKFAMKGEKENIAAMISCLFEGDGYASIKKRTIRIGYSTKSKRLAEQIQDLLLRFKIRSSVTEHKGFYKVGITDYQNIQRFSENIGFVTERKNQIINNYLKEKKIRRYVKNRLPLDFNESIIAIIKEENITQVGKYKQYDIIYDHQVRNDKFSFSADFLKNLLLQVKNEKNKEFLEILTGDIGWEKVRGVEVMDNEDEEWVYDVTIEPNHAFVSQAAILHNTVTISKANIQATLRSETSVLAAGNPKLGRFDPVIPIPQQINISPALLSRFDVIFVLRDIPNRVQDEAIASHVLEEHKQTVERDVIDPKLLRKYVAFARKIKPKLTDEAAEEIKEFYISIRNRTLSGNSEIKAIPITARQLEAIVRLSEACAKIRLSSYVGVEDARRAIKLLKYSMMQVGFDEETQTFDVDRITTGIPASKRNKIIIVRETISKLEQSLGKLIPTAELEKELGEKLTKEEIEDAINQLSKSGDIFKPKAGYIQKL